MSARTRTCLGLAIVLLAASVTRERAARVVVHPARSAELTVEAVAQIYLSDSASGNETAPNRAGECRRREQCRIAFTERVFGDQARRLATYWNRQYFQGILPRRRSLPMPR